METVRPLDVLNRTKGKEVIVSLKNGEVYNGKLKAFDIHLNLVLLLLIPLFYPNQNRKNTRDFQNQHLS